MFYIIETSEQLSNLHAQGECFIEVITNNDNYHPALALPSLIYYRAGDKGYILTLNHSEAFALDFEDVLKFISKHEKVYCLDQKYTSYFIPRDNLIDINQTIIDEENRLHIHECTTKVHIDFYSSTPFFEV